MTGRKRSAAILLVAVALALGGVLGFLWHITPETDETTVSTQGTLAMVLGIAFSLLVGIGLMTLVFYSARRGYDDEAHGRGGGPARPERDKSR